MDENTERQFRQADAAVDRAVTAFMVKIGSMPLKWDAVSRRYIVVLKLCDEIAKLIDHPDFAKHSMGPAMMKLSNALADYRDSWWEDRSTV